MFFSENCFIVIITFFVNFMLGVAPQGVFLKSLKFGKLTFLLIDNFWKLAASEIKNLIFSLHPILHIQCF